MSTQHAAAELLQTTWATGFREISVERLREAMEGLGERPLLLDVRRSEEYVDGHAPGVPLNGWLSLARLQAAGSAMPFLSEMCCSGAPFCCGNGMLWGATA